MFQEATLVWISWRGGLSLAFQPGSSSDRRAKVERILLEWGAAQKSGAGDFPPPVLGETLPQTWREAGLIGGSISQVPVQGPELWNPPWKYGERFYLESQEYQLGDGQIESAVVGCFTELFFSHLYRAWG